MNDTYFVKIMGPLQGSRVKIRGHMIAHRTPLSPRTIWWVYENESHKAKSAHWRHCKICPLLSSGVVVTGRRLSLVYIALGDSRRSMAKFLNPFGTKFQRKIRLYFRDTRIFLKHGVAYAIQELRKTLCQ